MPLPMGLSVAFPAEELLVEALGRHRVGRHHVRPTKTCQGRGRLLRALLNLQSGSACWRRRPRAAGRRSLGLRLNIEGAPRRRQLAGGIRAALVDGAVGQDAVPRVERDGARMSWPRCAINGVSASSTGPASTVATMPGDGERGCHQPHGPRPLACAPRSRQQARPEGRRRDPLETSAKSQTVSTGG